MLTAFPFIQVTYSEYLALCWMLGGNGEESGLALPSWNSLIPMLRTSTSSLCGTVRGEGLGRQIGWREEELGGRLWGVIHTISSFLLRGPFCPGCSLKLSLLWSSFFLKD